MVGGIVDMFTVESVSFHPRISLVHNFVNSVELSALRRAARSAIEAVARPDAAPRQRTGMKV